MLSSAAILAGCATAYARGELLVSTPPQLQNVMISVATGSSPSGLNQKDLDVLVPLLRNRLPKVFALNGIPVNPSGTLNGKDMILTVVPTRTSFSSVDYLAYLSFDTELYSVELKKKVWKGSLSISFNHLVTQFDEKDANNMALELMKQLQNGGLVPQGTLRAPG